MPVKEMSCPRCKSPMVELAERLDLSWAGDGPNAMDIEFQGILAEVYRCPGCGAQAVRPVTLTLPDRARVAAAV